jgi:hypothetical protein
VQFDRGVNGLKSSMVKRMYGLVAEVVSVQYCVAEVSRLQLRSTFALQWLCFAPK